MDYINAAEDALRRRVEWTCGWQPRLRVRRETRLIAACPTSISRSPTENNYSPSHCWESIREYSSEAKI